MTLRTLPESRPFGGRQTGFTLVELVAVILLIGILAAVGLPRFFGTDAYTDRAGVDRTVSAFRYAQQQALSRMRRVRVQAGSEALILKACSIRVEKGNSCNGQNGSWQVLKPPTSSASQWALGTPIAFAGPVFFNSLGQVVNQNGNPQKGTVSISVGGGTIQLIEATGMAHAV